MTCKFWKKRKMHGTILQLFWFYFLSLPAISHLSSFFIHELTFRFRSIYAWKGHCLVLVLNNTDKKHAFGSRTRLKKQVIIHNSPFSSASSAAQYSACSARICFKAAAAALRSASSRAHSAASWKKIKVKTKKKRNVSSSNDMIKSPFLVP